MQNACIIPPMAGTDVIFNICEPSQHQLIMYNVNAQQSACDYNNFIVLLWALNDYTNVKLIYKNYIYDNTLLKKGKYYRQILII